MVQVHLKVDQLQHISMSVLSKTAPVDPTSGMLQAVVAMFSPSSIGKTLDIMIFEIVYSRMTRRRTSKRTALGPSHELQKPSMKAACAKAREGDDAT